MVISGGVATATNYYSYVIADGGANLTINQLVRSSFTNSMQYKVLSHLQP
jgi:hypothetical protein